MDQRSGIPSGRRSGIVGGGHRLLAGCGRDYPRAAYQLRDAGDIVEILNSAIEAVVDRIGSEYP